MFGTIVLFALAIAGLESLANRPGTPAEQACGTEARQDHVNHRIEHDQVIQDPAIGLSWRVESDPFHPSGPRRLIELPDAVPCRQEHIDRIGRTERTGSLNATQRWVVRKGDSLLVSRDTRMVRTRLTAVALDGGAVGDSINVRLRFAAKVVRARIAGFGRALLIDDEKKEHR